MITKTQISITINKKLAEKLTEYAKTHHKGKLSPAIEKLIREALKG